MSTTSPTGDFGFPHFTGQPFTAVANSCPHCGMFHSGQCQRVKAIEYYQDGTVKRVEYHDSYTPLMYRHSDKETLPLLPPVVPYTDTPLHWQGTIGPNGERTEIVCETN